MSDKLVKVKDRSGLIRDPRTNAIISTDSKALAQQKNKKNIRTRNEQELLDLKDQVSDINTRVDNIEKMLQELLELNKS